MNCHGNNNKKGHKGPMSHMLMMLLCCAAPIIVLMLLPLLKVMGIGSGANSVLSSLSVLICPIMMFGMMFMMMKGQNGKKDTNGHCCNHSEEESKTKVIE